MKEILFCSLLGSGSRSVRSFTLIQIISTGISKNMFSYINNYYFTSVYLHRSRVEIPNSTSHTYIYMLITIKNLLAIKNYKEI